MSLTPHHAKYFAHDLTRRAAGGLDRLSMSLFDAAVDLNPHQIEAGNFYPDFILWLLAGGRQHVMFVDPKGIRRLPREDPKLRFCDTIKEIEQRLGDPSVRLDSFIVSNTSSATMRMQWSMDKAAMQARHIVFQEEDKDSYVASMLGAVAGAAPSDRLSRPMD